MIKMKGTCGVREGESHEDIARFSRKNLEDIEINPIFAASKVRFWLSGQNPERARLYRHYPFKRTSAEVLLVLSKIPFQKHFEIIITLNKTSRY